MIDEKILAKFRREWKKDPSPNLLLDFLYEIRPDPNIIIDLVHNKSAFHFSIRNSIGQQWKTPIPISIAESAAESEMEIFFVKRMNELVTKSRQVIHDAAFKAVK